MSRTYFTALNRLDETEVLIEYTISRYYPATWDDPAEGGEVEIIKTWENGGVGAPVDLTAAEEDKFREVIAETHEEEERDDD